jgi:biotin-[acetyl-CoA-carboxylase] ligase BirA-like protein
MQSRKSLNFYNIQECDSTMDQARSLIADGVELPFSLSTKVQHRGRGTHGRSWHESESGIYTSLALSCHEFKSGYDKLSLVVAAILAEKLDPGRDTIKIKAPNDLYCINDLQQAKKLAGILIESVIPKWIVIGYGINYFDAPKELGATSLNQAFPTIYTAKKRGSDFEFEDQLAMQLYLGLTTFFERGFIAYQTAYSAPLNY